MIFDLLFILLFVAGLAAGFFHGFFRLTAVLIAYYLSVVLASALYRMLGRFFMNQLNSTQSVSFYLAFAVILIVSFLALSAYGIYTVKDFKIPEQIGQVMYVDRIAGVFVSLIVTSLFLGMLGIILWNLMIVRGGATIDLPLMRLIGNNVRDSFLLRYFSTYVLPWAYNIADPILPSGARYIFAAGSL